MSSNTPNLGLLKKDPMVDGNETFNIETMLNENWDKVDEAVGRTGGYGVTTQPKANEYEVNLKPAPASLTAGIRVTVKVNAASTGAPMLNVNGLGSKPVLKTNGSSASFKQDGLYTLVYDGQAFILQGEGGEYGTATAAQVLSGYTLGTENGLVSGNIPDYSRSKLGQGYAQAVSAKGDHGGALVVEPAKGYYEPGVNSGGFGSIITTDPNYKPDNIRAGTSIFGVPGKSTVVDTADATIEELHVLSGKSGYAKGKKINGLMANRTTDQSAVSYEVSSGQYALRPPAGYYNGQVWVYRNEPGIKTENIRKGVNIGGVGGSLSSIKRVIRGVSVIPGNEVTAHADLSSYGIDWYGAILRFSSVSITQYTQHQAIMGRIQPQYNNAVFMRSVSAYETVTVFWEITEYESVVFRNDYTFDKSSGSTPYSKVLPDRWVNPRKTLVVGSYWYRQSSGGLIQGPAAAPTCYIEGTSSTPNINFIGESRNTVGTEYWHAQVIEFA
ncbi:hypothetical protein [Paenibacillus solani]|uniref:hypothetical protein n=1 Tax=Paenibacillus solani TaxID=1705565 RepID=UPI003D292538